MKIFAVGGLLPIGAILIMLFCSIWTVYGIEQVYDSDLGKIKVDLPMILNPKDQYGNALYLAKPGSEKPVISILIQEPYGESLKEYAASSGYKNKPLETTTNDGHKMDYYVDFSYTNNKDEPVYSFDVFIDYLEDKGKIIQIGTDSYVHGAEGEVARFTEEQFLEISKSFALINESAEQAIAAESTKTNETPGVGMFFAITCILGSAFCAIKRRK
ncbi:MAG: hypothetical protein QM438_10150 [Euryarchaeota archaeon]|nr:hypothetical protein [Euryarchaeota archaeon]